MQNDAHLVSFDFGDKFYLYYTFSESIILEETCVWSTFHSFSAWASLFPWPKVSLWLPSLYNTERESNKKYLGNNRPALTTRDTDADDLVHNSWSARANVPKDTTTDADDLVKNSWSARTIAFREAGTDADDLVHNSWSARSEAGILPREEDADADDLVHNSWSART